MSAVVSQSAPARLSSPLLGRSRAGAAIAFGPGGTVDAARFCADVEAVAAGLPAAAHAINLCEDRYHFLVGFCAVMLRGQVNLLPHSRAPEVVADAHRDHPDSYSLTDTGPDDHGLPQAPPRAHRLLLPAAPSASGSTLMLDPDACVAIGFTSGSSGRPTPNPKTWGGFVASSERNIALLQALLGAGGHPPDTAAGVVATVPPQHMYGMETSVLLPLLGAFAVHSGRPFFPSDIAAALAATPAPRLLVTTPVHLRALVQSGVRLPPLAGILSATAPLPVELAQAAEARFQAPLQEMFGSTETCVIAHRRTACEQAWTLYEGVELSPQPDGTRVQAPWLPVPVLLHDVVELLPGRRFALRGRSSDVIEIAGKRASLGDLTRRLLALPGVEDAVAFQTVPENDSGVCRVAALVVAPDRSEAELLEALRDALDPVFLPRPLKRVAALPRNDTGKLPRAALLAALRAP